MPRKVCDEQQALPKELIELAALSKAQANAGDSCSVRREAVVVPMSSIEPREIRWLWQSRIALGRISVIAGQGGIGKSYLMADVTARLSKGLAMPDGSLTEACDSLLISGEDDPGDTMPP